MPTTQDIDAAEEERRNQVRAQVTCLNYANRLRVWAKILEAFAIKIELPDPYNSPEYLMSELSRTMEKVISALGK